MAKNDPRNIELKRTKALYWWYTLTPVEQINNSIKYFPNRLKSSLTGREIEQIYNLEFTNKR